MSGFFFSESPITLHNIHLNIVNKSWEIFIVFMFIKYTSERILSDQCPPFFYSNQSQAIYFQRLSEYLGRKVSDPITLFESRIVWET